MQNTSSLHTVVAFVGMPGSGKSEAALFLKQKNFFYIRFGQVTDEGLTDEGLSQTAENEQMYREKLRKELGMAAYAIKIWPDLQKGLEEYANIVLDGLYSWEEYVYLKAKVSRLVLVYVFASPSVRHKRLSVRTVRPLTEEEAYARDASEIERLNKGGPIAMADYVIENNEDGLEKMFGKIEQTLKNIQNR